MYEAENLIDAIFIRDRLEEEMNKVQERLEILEAHGIESGSEYQSLLIELGELETQIAQYE